MVAIWAMTALCISLQLVVQAQAFVSPRPRSASRGKHAMAGFLDDMGRFFDGLGNNDDDRFGQSEVVEEVEGTYVGSKRILIIPAQTMKVGGLRLYLNLHLMACSNTPEKGCWKASQSDKSEVNLRYRDLSGSLIVRLTDEGVTVDRLGSTPSMKYLMHESIILNSFLDELHAIVYEGDISDENRLLTLVEGDAIEQARTCLSFA